MNHPTWQETHLAALRERLSRLRALPDGVVHDEDSGLHHIRIIKQARQIQFYFVDPGSGTLDGPMSRIDLDDPLRLLASYTQAIMLTLLWQPAPAQVCIFGLAGGRLSTIFYHYFPDAVIDNVDIDPSVVAIAGAFFGVVFDQRQRIFIQDARHFIRASVEPACYDVIVMDAFRDDTDNLDHLATRQFYRECAARLARGGVLSANVLRSDPLALEKVKTFLASFRHGFVSEQKHSLVLFGSDHARLARGEVEHRAAQLQREHGFTFPFVSHAAGLRPAREVAARSSLRDAPLLNDREPQ